MKESPRAQSATISTLVSAERRLDLIVNQSFALSRLRVTALNSVGRKLRVCRSQ